MIRFVDLGKQLAGDETDPDEHLKFAFFNTIDDHFIEVDGEQTWESWAEFEAGWNETMKGVEFTPRELHECQRQLERFRGLAHAWTKEPVK